MKREINTILAQLKVVNIFHGLWHIALQWPTEEQTLATQDKSREALFSKFLQGDDEGEVCKKLRAYVSKHIGRASLDDTRGLVLDIMSAVDLAFSQIHPRKQSAGGVLRPKPVKGWLKEYRTLRRDAGSYMEGEADRVIPRGPLAKVARSKDAAYATNLEDWFSFLSVVPIVYECRGRKIRTEVKVLNKSGVMGFSRDPEQNDDVSVIPIAEASAELDIRCSTRNSKHFARYQSADPKAVVDRVLSILGVEDTQGPSISLAPELLVDTSTADDIAARYGEIAHPPRLFVCGSGHTQEVKAGQAWNESRVINIAGIELWRQRKIWPASMDGATARTYKLTDPTPGHLHEDNCAGDKLVIADLDDLGRCLIMICQDFEATSLAEVVIRCYQPDWVFVPILDRSVDVGRWGHSRAFNLSGLSQARFIIVSSTALYDRCKGGSSGKMSGAQACGLLVSPKVGEEEDSRVYRSLIIPEEATQRTIRVSWKPKGKGWKKTTIS
ncbi:hypothetical protein [Pseudomonas sp. NyZ201]|uniref:hypothetical protein n=1 Tax=Pseudomonas sp. NyZ201 TaxID=3409857 RepID=UPI003CF5AA39